MDNIEFSGLSLNIFDLIDTYIPAWIIFIVGGLLVLSMIAYHLRKKRFKSVTIKYSDIRIVKQASRTKKQKLRFILTVLRLTAVVLLIVAFARPRSGTEYQEVTSEGVDVMLLLDVSSSMQGEDFKPNNRLYVAKEEIKNFINKRLNDRIGLVVFARYAYTQCPLTTDYGVLLNFVDQVDFGLVEDGTAIGMAIATAVNRLRESKSKSKIIVLLTDGDNNAGEIDPITAANLAATFDIKIYTIAVGKKGNVMFPYQDPLFGKRYVYQPTKIDEKSLKEIAAKTNGEYYRARSGEELEQIYGIIDNMEKTEIEVASHIQYKELFHYFGFLGMFLLILEIIFANTYFRKLP
ncbi:MAG: VWA domain-containing protein [candidate division Zixibacteria bacterium]|nr:VWA domain-containing protein [candidate division Zixibacteria bacterium]